MSDAWRVEVGSVPWAPAPDLELGEVLDRWDVPRAGLLHQSGASYFFECILGDGAPTSVWAYAHVDDAEMEALLGMESIDDFDKLSARLLRDRWVTVAAADDDKILTSMIFDAGVEGAEGLVRRLIDHLDRIGTARSRVQELTPA